MPLAHLGQGKGAAAGGDAHFFQRGNGQSRRVEAAEEFCFGQLKAGRPVAGHRIHGIIPGFLYIQVAGDRMRVERSKSAKQVDDGVTVIEFEPEGI